MADEPGKVDQENIENDPKISDKYKGTIVD